MITTFNAAHVRHLLALSRAATERMPTFGQLGDPDYWRDDMTDERREMLMDELEDEGFPMSVTQDDVDRTKLPAGLLLVGDQGIYLMSQDSIENVKAAAVADPAFAEAVKGIPTHHAAFAHEANPDTMTPMACFDAKRAIFGGDDGVEFLDAESLDIPLEGDTLTIDITEEAIIVMAPLDPEDASPRI